jgi:hypothetical protein
MAWKVSKISVEPILGPKRFHELATAILRLFGVA